MDHRHDDAAIVSPLLIEEFIERRNRAGVLNIADSQCHQILEHLIFELVAIDHQKHGRLLCLVGLEKKLRGLDHRVRLAASLRMPHKPARTRRIKRTPDNLFDSCGLMLPEDDIFGVPPPSRQKE